MGPQEGGAPAAAGSPSSTTLLQSTNLTLRTLPANSYLVHATNCLGVWGFGIAAELGRMYPAARKEYEEFCRAAAENASQRWPPRDALIGRCLVIPPQESDVAKGSPRVSIVCLFTSHGYGRASKVSGKPGRDSPSAILAATRRALVGFREQLDAERGRAEGCLVYSPFFNAGAFKVPWEKTARVIEEEFKGWGGKWLVLTPPK
ncbi:uncharacterized protein E0L32_002319 [Thyridium curvatum]|uniref:Uncharacterized protein n=1 Tax=Thyridium curvatum TaxID=1093900 RepID=A0A507AI88_9PEZI|nr:uncharacterized protein E0L32_002319 [Thyridium curvatum]TPX06823.1 hypothetical protein E0L32_002319 [Thyridium curvatum]